MRTNCRKAGISVLISLLALSLFIGILPPVQSSAKIFTDALNITLPEPLSFRSVPIPTEGETGTDYSPHEKDYTEQMKYLEGMSQTAFDAFIMDRPLESMWLDDSKSTFVMRSVGSISDLTSPWDWTIDQVTVNTKSLPAFTDPAGSVAAVNTMLEDWFTPKGTTLYEKVKSIHDFVCLITTYSKSTDFCYCPYGTLAVGKCVCEGYAETFKLLCEKHNIECIVVSGVARSLTGKERHAWNYVKMDDGEWYAVDTTWDDNDLPTPDTTYFLVGTDTVINKVSKKKFTDDHIVSGDISGFDYKTFELPTLSRTSYVPGSGNNKTSLGSARNYYYNQLDANGKAYYDALLNMTAPSGSPAMTAPETARPIETEEPEDTDPPATTTGEKESTDTKKPTETESTHDTTESEKNTGDPTDTVGSDTSVPRETDPEDPGSAEGTTALTDLPGTPADTSGTGVAPDTGSDSDTGKKTDTAGKDTVTVTGTLPAESGTSAVNGHGDTDSPSGSGSKTGLLIIGGIAFAAAAAAVVLTVRKKK